MFRNRKRGAFHSIHLGYPNSKARGKHYKRINRSNIIKPNKMFLD